MRVRTRRPPLRVLASWLSCAALLAGMSVAGTGIAAAATAAPGAPKAPAAPAATTPACQVTYTPNDWGSGFTVNITITNNGPAITSWTLAYSYSGNQKLVNGWSSNWS